MPGCSLRSIGSFSVPALLACSLAACGGGGGGSSSPPPPPVSIAYSSTNLTFTAPTPWAAQPANQVVTGTLSGTASGTLYITIVNNNPELFNVTNVDITSNSTGQATIVPVLPSAVGAGPHTGSLVVRACLNDASCNTGQLSGSPRTITVHYDIPTNVDRDTVTPYVVTANAAGEVILRGSGFAATTTASFGGNPGSVSFTSATELHVGYPALPAGSYDVTLGGGAVSFTGTLVAVDPPAFAQGFLAHAATPSNTLSLLYDAGRKTLLAVLAPAAGIELVRYDHSGSVWAAPVYAGGTLPTNLRQIRMSHDGSRILGLASSGTPLETRILEYDPATLDQLADTVLDNADAIAAGVSLVYGESFVLTDDGNLILSGRLPGSGSTYPLLFRTASREYDFLTVERDTMYSSVAAGDGSFALLTTQTQPAIEYDASTGLISRVSGNFISNFDGPPTASLSGSRIQSGTGIADADFDALGNAASGAVAGVVDRDGTRFYTYEPGADLLHTYDLTGAPTGPDSVYPEVDSPVALAGDPGNSTGVRMTITPDGGTVFISGPLGIAVQPTPP